MVTVWRQFFISLIFCSQLSVETICLLFSPSIIITRCKGGNVSSVYISHTLIIQSSYKKGSIKVSSDNWVVYKQLQFNHVLNNCRSLYQLILLAFVYIQSTHVCALSGDKLYLYWPNNIFYPLKTSPKPSQKWF